MEGNITAETGVGNRMELLELIDSAIDAWLSGAAYVTPFKTGFRLKKEPPFHDLVHSWNENWRESVHGNGRIAVCAALELEINEYGKHDPLELVDAYLRSERNFAQTTYHKFTRQAPREHAFRKQTDNEARETATRDMLRRVIYCIKLEEPQLIPMIVARIEKANYHNENERRELENTIKTINDKKFAGIDLNARMKDSLLALKGNYLVENKAGNHKIYLANKKWHPRSNWHKVHTH